MNKEITVQVHVKDKDHWIFEKKVTETGRVEIIVSSIMHDKIISIIKDAFRSVTQNGESLVINPDKLLYLVDDNLYIEKDVDPNTGCNFTVGNVYSYKQPFRPVKPVTYIGYSFNRYIFNPNDGGRQVCLSQHEVKAFIRF